MSVQNINGAVIQWQNYTSTKNGAQSFTFPEEFASDNVSVITNRTTAGAGDILPVTSVDAFSFSIDRSSDILGNSPFNALAIGPDSVDGENRATTPGGAVIQWGTAQTTTDKSQTINFPTPFSTNCGAVLVNRMEPNGQSVIPVTSATKSSFTVNRTTTINGTQEFLWVAIGDCDLNTEDCFSFSLGDGYVMKGGKAIYDTSGGPEETVSFSSLKLTDFPNGCQTVLTARTKSGVNDILPVTAMSTSGFTVIPDSNLKNGQYFYWVAIGR